MMLKHRLSFALTLFLLLMMVAAAWEALDFVAIASYFPLSVVVVGAVLAVIEAVQSRPRAVMEAKDDSEDEQYLRIQIRGGLRHLAGLAGYLVAIVIVGFFTATAGYLVATLWRGAGFRLPHALWLTVIAVLFLFWFAAYIGTVFPPRLVGDVVIGRFVR